MNPFHPVPSNPTSGPACSGAVSGGTHPLLQPAGGPHATANYFARPADFGASPPAGSGKVLSASPSSARIAHSSSVSASLYFHALFHRLKRSLPGFSNKGCPFKSVGPGSAPRGSRPFEESCPIASNLRPGIRMFDDSQLSTVRRDTPSWAPSQSRSCPDSFSHALISSLVTQRRPITESCILCNASPKRIIVSG